MFHFLRPCPARRTICTNLLFNDFRIQSPSLSAPDTGGTLYVLEPVIGSIIFDILFLHQSRIHCSAFAWKMPGARECRAWYQKPPQGVSSCVKVAQTSKPNWSTKLTLPLALTSVGVPIDVFLCTSAYLKMAAPYEFGANNL